MLLKQGFASVELAFVRVEQDDPAGADTLQVVPYAFDQQDKEELEQLIWEYVQKASRS